MINNYIVDNNTQDNDHDDDNAFMNLFNLLNLLFTIIWTNLFGVTAGFAIVSYIVYDKNEYNDSNDSNEPEENENDKYYQELIDLPERVLTKEELKNLRLNVIEEELPNGKVIMTYNSDNETFWYYSDYKSVSYLVLDKISRLFAITYNCKTICINYKKELEKAQQKYDEKMGCQKELEEKEKTEQEKETNPKEKSVFASFKKYNTNDKNNNVNANNNGGSANKGTNNKGTNNKGTNNKGTINNIIPEKSNRFNYKGSLQDYIKYNNSNNIYNHNSDGIVKLDYATFKSKRMIYEGKNDSS